MLVLHVDVESCWCYVVFITDIRTSVALNNVVWLPLRRGLRKKLKIISSFSFYGRNSTRLNLEYKEIYCVLMQCVRFSWPDAVSIIVFVPVHNY